MLLLLHDLIIVIVFYMVAQRTKSKNFSSSLNPSKEEK